MMLGAQPNTGMVVAPWYGNTGGTAAMPPNYYVMPRRATKRSPNHMNESASSDRSAITLRCEPDVDAAWKLLGDLGLSSSMQELSDNARRLMGVVLQDFVHHFNQNASELMQCGVLREVIDREMLTQPIFRPPGHNTSRANVSLSDMLSHFVHEPLFQSKCRPGVNLLIEHKSFERFLNVRHREDEAAYVWSRIQTLAEDSYLGQARWDGGGFWKGKEWTKDLPSDSEIIMNAFCALLDGMLPPTTEGDRPFKLNHFLQEVPPRGIRLRGRYLIFQSQTNPAHYKVIVNGKVQEVLPGKTNGFHAIVLFLHAVKQQKSGHLGTINLHQVLEQVFDTS